MCQKAPKARFQEINATSHLNFIVEKSSPSPMRSDLVNQRHCAVWPYSLYAADIPWSRSTGFPEPVTDRLVLLSCGILKRDAGPTISLREQVMNTEAPTAAELRARMHDYWWLFVIDGIVMALLGLAIFFISIFSPEAGIRIFDLIFGWMLIIWGVVGAVRVYYATQAGDPPIIWLAPIAIFALGLILVIMGEVGVINLMWIFGLILLVLGVLESISGFSMDQETCPVCRALWLISSHHRRAHTLLSCRCHPSHCHLVWDWRVSTRFDLLLGRNAAPPSGIIKKLLLVSPPQCLKTEIRQPNTPL